MCKLDPNVFHIFRKSCICLCHRRPEAPHPNHGTYSHVRLLGVMCPHDGLMCPGYASICISVGDQCAREALSDHGMSVARQSLLEMCPPKRARFAIGLSFFRRLKWCPEVMSSPYA